MLQIIGVAVQGAWFPAPSCHTSVGLNAVEGDGVQKLERSGLNRALNTCGAHGRRQWSIAVDLFGRTPVVTCFLERHGRILLLRRSHRVGSYAGLWAGVSGYVEHVPLEQAVREICEELGVRVEDITLRAVGPPVPVDDTDQRRYWLVYPFLFRAPPAFSPKPNWETVETRWVDPAAIAEYETVPGLQQVFSTVWPPFGSRALWRAAKRIAADCTSGATHLAVDSMRALQAFSRTRMACEDAHLIVRAARALAALRPSMGVIAHVMALALRDLDGLSKLPPALTEASQRCAELAAKKILSLRRIATYSASSVCEQALRLWARFRPEGEVTVSEARPKLEGLALAARLAASGLRVRLVTDAQMGLALREADVLLVGADAISQDDRLINKVGTQMLVMAAHEGGIPVYAVCQTHKIAPPSWPLTLERQPPEDVCKPQGFRVQNVVFDATPLDLFTEVITESGPLTRHLLHKVRAALERSALAIRNSEQE